MLAVPFMSPSPGAVGRIATRALLVVSVLVASACAPASRPAISNPISNGPNSAQQPRPPQGTLTLAWAQEPSNLRPKFGEQGFVGADLGNIFDSALTAYDDRGALIPLMARHLPTQDNGDWVINPEGSMVTVFRLRDNVRWHDGVPLTAQDFVFAHQVDTDPAVPFSRTNEGLMTTVEARDDQTVAIRWSETYVRANEASDRCRATSSQTIPHQQG